MGTYYVAATLAEYCSAGHSFTVADMAERTGLPKRGLDKYMLRSNASLPGYDALISLSQGLGVSLDWLVLGEDFSGEGVDLLVQMAATKTALTYFETLLRYQSSVERPFSNNEEILGTTPEEWAISIGHDTGEAAKERVKRGIIRQELLTWAASSKERSGEILMDCFHRLRDEKA